MLSDPTISFIIVHYCYNDNECLQQQMELLTNEYHAAIKRGEVFSEVKKIYLAIKKIKIQIKKQSEDVI